MGGCVFLVFLTSCKSLKGAPDCVEIWREPVLPFIGMIVLTDGYSCQYCRRHIFLSFPGEIETRTATRTANKIAEFYVELCSMCIFEESYVRIFFGWRTDAVKYVGNTGQSSNATSQSGHKMVTILTTTVGVKKVIIISFFTVRERDSIKLLRFCGCCEVKSLIERSNLFHGI